jgi:hypothetical protein
MFGGSAAVRAPIDRFVISVQFGCEGTWMLLRQQQKPSASCSRGAHSLSHALILALMCECIVFFAAGCPAPPPPHAGVAHAPYEAARRFIHFVSLFNQLYGTTRSHRSWHSVSCARSVS